MIYNYVCSLTGHDIPNKLSYSIAVEVDIPDEISRDEIIRCSCLGTSLKVRISKYMGAHPKECPKWSMFGYKTTWQEVHAKSATVTTQPVDNLMSMDVVEFVEDTMERYSKECNGSAEMALTIFAEKHRREYNEVKKEYEELIKE